MPTLYTFPTLLLFLNILPIKVLPKFKGLKHVLNCLRDLRLKYTTTLFFFFDNSTALNKFLLLVRFKINRGFKCLCIMYCIQY